MLVINKDTEYALLLIGHLADQDKFSSITDIVQKTRMPKRYLARIATELASSEILDSKEGVNGGFKLKRALSRISLYDVLSIFNKELEVVSCESHKYDCKFKDLCKHKGFFMIKFAGRMKRFLQTTYLDKVYR
ncbi:MAG: Rrf2 family transcriptional regulator [Candidatus Dojkabacteria bacterium]|jgi:Rrf2 family protein|nr:Rrf2 family transcriptional regulator [Candidatus Dojkabacteria bacterium]